MKTGINRKFRECSRNQITRVKARIDRQVASDWTKMSPDYSAQIAEIVAAIPNPVFVSREQATALCEKLKSEGVHEKNFWDSTRARNSLIRDTLQAAFRPDETSAEYLLVDQILWERMHQRVGIAPKECGPYYYIQGSSDLFKNFSL